MKYLHPCGSKDPGLVQADTLRTLFPASVLTAQRGTTPYDVTADGQRFLPGQAVEGGSAFNPFPSS